MIPGISVSHTEVQPLTVGLQTAQPTGRGTHGHPCEGSPCSGQSISTANKEVWFFPPSSAHLQLRPAGFSYVTYPQEAIFP